MRSTPAILATAATLAFGLAGTAYAVESESPTKGSWHRD
jgi:hypothetical protein